MQASFLSMTRDQYFDKHVKNQTKGPPVAYYRTNYASLDQKVGVPLYGSENDWGGKLAKKSKEIKETNFRDTVHTCERINRTLVYKRNNPNVFGTDT